MVVPRAAALLALAAAAVRVAVRDLAAVVALEVVILEVVVLEVVILEAAVVFLAATLPDVSALRFAAILAVAVFAVALWPEAVCATHTAKPLNMAPTTQTRVVVLQLNLRAIYAASPNPEGSFVRLSSGRPDLANSSPTHSTPSPAARL
jgi:hypothetical protein